MPDYRSKLEEVLTYEQFLEELEEFKNWTSHAPRRRANWHLSIVDYFEGNR